MDEVNMDYIFSKIHIGSKISGKMLCRVVPLLGCLQNGLRKSGVFDRPHT